MVELSELLSLIQTRQLITESLFRGVDLDQVLDKRDRSPFANDIARVQDEIDAMVLANPLPQACRKLVGEIAKESYFRVFELTQHAEAAGYVSDDLELVAMAKLVGYTDDLVDTLLSSYKKHKLPDGHTAREG